MATITASPRPLRRTRTFESLQDVMPSAGPSNTDSLASSSSATSATTSSQPSHDVDANRGDEPKARGRTWTVDSSEDSMPQAGPSNIPSSFGSPPQPSTATLTGGRGFVPLPGRELIRTTRSLMCPASPPALATLPSPSQLPYVANPDSGPPPPRKHRSPTSPTNTEPLGYDPCPPGQREIMQTLREMGIKVRDFEYEEGTKELRRALMRRETVSTVVSEDNASDGGRGEQVSASYTNPPASTELGTSTDNTTPASLNLEKGSLFQRRRTTPLPAPTHGAPKFDSPDTIPKSIGSGPGKRRRLAGTVPAPAKGKDKETSTSEQPARSGTVASSNMRRQVAARAGTRTDATNVGKGKASAETISGEENLVSKKRGRDSDDASSSKRRSVAVSSQPQPRADQAQGKRVRYVAGSAARPPSTHAMTLRRRS